MSHATMPNTIAKIPNVVAKKRLESFDVYNKANSIGGKTKHDPKSGCKKINTIGIKNTIIILKMILSELLKLVILERVKIAEAKINVAILAGSEACTEKNFRLSQRCAPYTFIPKGDHINNNRIMDMA